MDARKLTAVLAVTVLLSVAAVPLFQEDSDAVSEPAAMTKDSMAVAPLALGAGGGFVIGLVVGIWIGISISDPDDPAGDQEAIYQQCRDLYSMLMTSNLDTAKNLISSIMPADSTLWSFTTNYWNRATELSVADPSGWSLDKEYQPNLMTENAYLRQNAMNYIYDWQAAVDSAYNNVLSKNTALTGDCYGDMVLSINWNNGSLTPGSGEDVRMDLLQVVETTAADTLVYIDTSTVDHGGSYNSQTSGMLYALGRDVQLTYVGGGSGTGATYTVENGSPSDVTSWPSGLYRIDTSGAVLAGPLSKASSGYVDYGSEYRYLEAADVVGGMIVVSGDTYDDTTLFMSYGEGVVGVRQHGVTTLTNELTIDIDYTGRDANHRESVILGTVDGQDYDIIGDWNDMIQSINYVIDQAATAGETIWLVFDAAEESNSFISPSSVTSTMNIRVGEETSNGLTASQSAAVYIQSMMSIAEYWTDNGGELVDAEFETNAESLSVYVYGDIYYNGELWASEVIVTPYMSLDRQDISVGNRIEWNGPGYAMLWAQGVDIEDFDTEAMLDSTDYELLDMSRGYVIEVRGIVHDGESVDSITLEPTIILRDTTGSDGIDDPPEPVKVMNANTLIIIIFMLVGLIAFLVCERFGQPVIGLILALVIVLIGLVGNNWLVNGILYGEWWIFW